MPAAAATPLAEEQQQARGVSSSETGGTHRERLLLDSRWRFHFGHANDSAKDFLFA